MYQIFSYIKSASIYNDASSKIGNIEVLNKAAKIAGKRPMITKIPSLKQETTEKDQDTYKRWVYEIVI